MLVVGTTRNGVFNALAYKNLSTSVEGNEGWVMMLVFGIISPIAGISTITTFSDPFFGILPTIGGCIFIAIGMYMLFRGNRILQAVKQLGQDTSRP
ncbi:MAG: hypothetical protein U1F55_09055 [Chitinivorax sp.]